MSYELTHAQGELLGRLRPANTAAATIYQADELRTEITLITASLTPSAAGPVAVGIYHDDAGVVYGDNSIVTNPSMVKGASAIVFQAQHPGSGIMIKPGGSLGVSSATASAVNFSVYGITSNIAERVRGMGR